MSDPSVDPAAKHMVGTDGTANLPGEKLVIIPGESLTARAGEIATLLRELRESVLALERRISAADKRATTSFERATESEATAGLAFDRATESEATAGRARKVLIVVSTVLLLIAVLTMVVALRA